MRLVPVLVFPDSHGQIVQVNINQIVALSKRGSNYYMSTSAPVLMGGFDVIRISKPSYTLLCGLTSPMNPTSDEIEVELVSLELTNKSNEAKPNHG